MKTEIKKIPIKVKFRTKDGKVVSCDAVKIVRVKKPKCQHERRGIFAGKVFCKSCKLVLNENIFK